MMTSLLLVDVEGVLARSRAAAVNVSPSTLVAELTHTMHGLSRQVMVLNAYCGPNADLGTRARYRDAGFAIIDTAGADETLIQMSLDLAALATGDAIYEEAILLGGGTDYTALARLARANHMLVSVCDHAAIPASLEALADGLIELDDYADTPSANADPSPEAEITEAEDSADDGHKDEPDAITDEPDDTDDTWPTPSSGPVLIATAGAAALAHEAMEPPQAVEEPALDTPVEPPAPPLKEIPAPLEPVPASLDDAAAASHEPIISNEVAESGEEIVADSEDLSDDDQFDELFADLGNDLSHAAGLTPPEVPTAPEPEQPASPLAEPVIATPDPLPNDSGALGGVSASEPLVDPVQAAPEVEPVKEEAKSGDELTAEVDELLSRLMSDSLSAETNADAPKLDVVPER